MTRLFIDITPEEHRKLKAIAALKGQSLKDYVMSRTLGDAPDTSEMTEDDARQALVDFLNDRVAKARAGSRSGKTVMEIAEAARREYSS